MRKLLYTLYVLSNLADLIFTICGVELTGPGKEANPVARSVLLGYGATGLSVFKLMGMVVILILITILAHIKWDDLCVNKYMPNLLLFLGILISSVGVWSWLGIF